MQTIQLPSTDQFYSLNDLTGYALGTSIIVTNNTNRPLRIFDNGPKPNAVEVEGFPVWPGFTALVHGNDVSHVWIRGGSDGYVIAQPLTSTVIPLTGVEFPQDIVTSGVEGFRRLQVDPAQTGFFEGREFRVAKKIEVPANDSLDYKFFSTVDFILTSIDITISQGEFEVYIWTGDNVTEDTPFTTPVTFFAKNESSEFRLYDGGRYQSGVTITSGNAITITDEDLYRDYVKLRSDGKTVNASLVVSNRYLPANVNFYIEIRSNVSSGGNTSIGSFSASWEERPVGVK